MLETTYLILMEAVGAFSLPILENQALEMWLLKEIKQKIIPEEHFMWHLQT